MVENKGKDSFEKDFIKKSVTLSIDLKQAEEKLQIQQADCIEFELLAQGKRQELEQFISDINDLEKKSHLYDFLANIVENIKYQEFAEILSNINPSLTMIADLPWEILRKYRGWWLMYTLSSNIHYDLLQEHESLLLRLLATAKISDLRIAGNTQDTILHLVFECKVGVKVQQAVLDIAEEQDFGQQNHNKHIPLGLAIIANVEEKILLEFIKQTRAEDLIKTNNADNTVLHLVNLNDITSNVKLALIAKMTPAGVSLPNKLNQSALHISLLLLHLEEECLLALVNKMTAESFLLENNDHKLVIDLMLIVGASKKILLVTINKLPLKVLHTLHGTENLGNILLEKFHYYAVADEVQQALKKRMAD